MTSDRDPICLVIPPSPFLLDERVFMSLGVLKIAAVLEQQGLAVEVLDLSGIENCEEALTFHALNTTSTCFGFTATTPQMPQAAKLARVLQQIRPQVKTILGGPHPTLTYAAVKKERARGLVGRAERALGQMEAVFDVLVCGDGEKAIFEAIRPDAPGLIDADDPKTDLFLTNKTLNETPFPARHLVDVESYHYQIDGERAISLIAQLGCLTGDTCITMGDGLQLPIKDVQKGDVVLSYDVDEKVYRRMPVKETWKREANDLYECTFNDGTILKVTAEHPLWTPSGWSTVEDLCPMQDMVYFNNPSTGKILFKTMLRGLAENAYTPVLAESRSGRDARKMENDVSCGETQEIEYKNIACQCENASSENDFLGDQEGRQESNETSGRCGQSVCNDKETVGKLLFRKNERGMEIRKAEASMGSRSNKDGSQSYGTRFIENPSTGSSLFQICREWRFLARPLSFWQKAKSRFFGFWSEEGDSSSWRILAFSKIKSARDCRLFKRGVNASSDLVQRTQNEKPSNVNQEDISVWKKLVSKKFVGKSTVYNLTVHPVHTYFANNVLVHNCPFQCGFCGGRNSPMLRRVRTRTTANIVDEMTCLYQAYGVKGFMMYDDELNVNPQMVELMNAISDKQEELGVAFKLRGFIKSQLFTDQQAVAMYRAGFRWILTGFESGSPRILQNINKRATREENTRCVEIARRHGLKVKALMSIGHPGESPQTLQETKDWLIENKPDDFDVTIITPYPGSPYFDDAVERDGKWIYTYPQTGDRLFMKEVDYFAKADFYKGGGSDEGYTSYVWTETLTDQELVSERDRLERDVRRTLGIPFNPQSPAQRFEHSMGQGLPEKILKRSKVFTMA